jgi:hypothetical protein
MVDENLFKIKEIPNYISSSIITCDSKNFDRLNKNINYNDIEYSVNDLIKCTLLNFSDKVCLAADKLNKS